MSFAYAAADVPRDHTADGAPRSCRPRFSCSSSRSRRSRCLADRRTGPAFRLRHSDLLGAIYSAPQSFSPNYCTVRILGVFVLVVACACLRRSGRPRVRVPRSPDRGVRLRVAAEFPPSTDVSWLGKFRPYQLSILNQAGGMYISVRLVILRSCNEMRAPGEASKSYKIEEAKRFGRTADRMSSHVPASRAL
jgi:hypothetical protein